MYYIIFVNIKYEVNIIYYYLNLKNIVINNIT